MGCAFGRLGDDAAGTDQLSIFYAATDYNSNLDNIWRTRDIGGSGNHRFTFAVPLDLSTVVSLVLIGIPIAGAAGPARDIDLNSQYALAGEARTTNAESDTTTTYDLSGTADQVTEVVDLLTVFSSLEAGHLCGLEVDHNAIGGTIEYLGIRLVYNQTT